MGRRYARGMSLVAQVRADRVIDRSLHVVTEYQSLQEFLEAPSIPAGIQSIWHNGCPIDVMFQPNGQPTTIVTFHGASDENTRLPYFVGAGITNGLPVNRIYLCDPSLYLSKTLRLAWYLGSEVHPRLQADLDKIVDRLLEAAGSERVIFFGSSGGGFAALRMSARFPDSAALVVNPQISVGAYFENAVSQYMYEMWGADYPDDLPGTTIHDLSRLYVLKREHSNTIGYLQNTRDMLHVNGHQRRFVSWRHAPGAVWVGSGAWGPEGDDGHRPPPKEVLHDVLEHLVASDGNWAAGLERAGLAQA